MLRNCLIFRGSSEGTRIRPELAPSSARAGAESDKNAERSVDVKNDSQ
jgi:hypothetical protein